MRPVLLRWLPPSPASWRWPADSAQAHGPDHEVIVALTAELARNPGDPELLLHRGERYRSHGDLASARLDFQAALSNNPACQPARLRLALVARDQDRSSRSPSNSSIKPSPPNPPTFSRASLAPMSSSDPAATAKRFPNTIESSPSRPSHDLTSSFPDPARSSRTTPTRGHEALEGIEDGIRRLGPVPSLQLHALELEERGGRVDAALGRIDAIMAGMERRERWLARRGDVLLAAGRARDARAEYQRARAALDRLPNAFAAPLPREELRRELDAKLAVTPPKDQTSPGR